MIERNVYEVKYQILTRDEHAGNHRKVAGTVWSNGDIHVLANGTVRGAIEKAEKFLLSKVDKFNTEYGEPMLQRTLKVRVTSCERVLTLDI
jgi:predicted acyltransferase (DUF342 family)